ncbi:MFS transporter [Pseudonocardia sp.]|jgi:MFS family permease|uniref:MFS transporter n=1 Tax=Pseudonocardia sp. TaxID=60912 RepID=UPI0031FBC2BC
MAAFWSWPSPSAGSCCAGAPASRRRRQPRPDRLPGSAPLASPAYRAALAASFAHGWAVFEVRVALVPLLVVEALGQPEAWGGIGLAVFAAGNASTLVLAGPLADRRGRRPPILVGLAVSGIATGVLGFVTSPPLFLAVSLVAGTGSGLVDPPMNAAVADVIGSRALGAACSPVSRRPQTSARSSAGARGRARGARRVRRGLSP